MRVKMYSDGSRLDGDKGQAVTICLTDNDYLGYVQSSHNTQSSSKMELIGVLQGLNYLVRNRIDTSNVTSYVDHESISAIYEKYRDKNIDEAKLEFKDIWQEILRLSYTLVRLHIKYIKGHQEKHNCNKTCDILAAMQL